MIIGYAEDLQNPQAPNPEWETFQQVIDRALARLEDADAWGRIRRALAEGIAALTSAVPDLSVPDLTVHLTVGDPGDA